MRRLCFPVVILLILVFVLTGCASKSSTSATTTVSNPPSSTTANTQPISSSLAQSTTTAAPGSQIVRGGTLRLINGSGPSVLGYYPEMGPFDEFIVIPGIERPLEFDTNHELAPNLVTSWEVGADQKSLIFHIKKGIKFTDGSDLNAKSVCWNYQMAKESGRLQFNEKLIGVEQTDDYTMTLRLQDWSPMYIYSFGWVPIYSEQAFIDHGGKDWARLNPVGTGPFMMKEFVRDDHITWVKNPNYWQPGKPYLDAINIRFIPDATTASNMLQAKEVDMWLSVSAKYITDLSAGGMSWYGAFGNCSSLIPNIKDPASKWNNLKLRQAVDCALDRVALAKALGYGIGKPLYQVAPLNEYGNDPAYKGNQYDPARAKQLLIDAGYPNGLKISILTQQSAQDIGTAYKSMLDAVGFNCDLDLADPGRFFGAVMGSGWPDLCALGSGVDPPFTVTFLRFWGPQRMFPWASFMPPTDIQPYIDAIMAAPDSAGLKDATVKAVRYISDNSLVIPTYWTPTGTVFQPYVHTDYLHRAIGAMATENWWMDKH